MPQVPAVKYLELADPHHLIATICLDCRALYFDRRNACAKCFGTSFGSKMLSNEGQLRAFTFVGRVKRPYVSAIIDLDGGGVVKANLLGVEDPTSIQPKMRVVMDTFIAGTDDDGTEAVAFGYRRRGADDGQR
jgi:uncharacterized protein